MLNDEAQVSSAAQQHPEARGRAGKSEAWSQMRSMGVPDKNVTGS